MFRSFIKNGKERRDRSVLLKRMYAHCPTLLFGMKATADGDLSTCSQGFNNFWHNTFTKGTTFSVWESYIIVAIKMFCWQFCHPFGINYTITLVILISLWVLIFRTYYFKYLYTNTSASFYKLYRRKNVIKPEKPESHCREHLHLWRKLGTI